MPVDKITDLIDRNVVEQVIHTRLMIPGGLAAEILRVHGTKLTTFLHDTGRHFAEGYDGAAIFEWLGY